MKVFVTGVCGQLGHDVMNELSRQSIEAVGSDVLPACDSPYPYVPLDITDSEAVKAVISSVKPDAVIHCAAWTAVDAAEDEANIHKVHLINATGTENIALSCKMAGCKLMYISTDYVFDGQGTLPWDPDCKAFAPLNVYGKSKLDGEQAVAANLDSFFIVRIAWVFGRNGNNFIKTMLRLSEKYSELRVVNDQIGTPTYTYDLARLLVDMIQTDKFGYYHATNEGGFISWYDFAVEIFRQAHKDITVHPVSTEEYGLSKARRPFNSRLDKTKLIEKGFEPLPDWRNALSRYLCELESAENE